MKTTISTKEIVLECYRQSRLNGADYGGSVTGYRSDRRNIVKGRVFALECLEMALILNFRQYKRAQVLRAVAGVNGYGPFESRREMDHLKTTTDGDRFEVKENSFHYCPGQYAPTEIWWAFARYLRNHYEAARSIEPPKGW